VFIFLFFQQLNSYKEVSVQKKEEVVRAQDGKSSQTGSCRPKESPPIA